MSSFLPNIIVVRSLDPAEPRRAASTKPTLAKQRSKAGFDRLTDFQHADGGWGWWKEDASRRSL